MFVFLLNERNNLKYNKKLLFFIAENAISPHI